MQFFRDLTVSSQLSSQKRHLLDIIHHITIIQKQVQVITYICIVHNSLNIRFFLIILLVVFGLFLKSHAQQKNLFFNGIDSIVRLDLSTQPASVNYIGNANASIQKRVAHYEDELGNVLFYVAGDGIYRNSTGAIMPGSVGLATIWWEGEIQICPKPGNLNQYYVFFMPGACNYLDYCIVDMNLAGGQGDVIQLNTVLSTNLHSAGLEIVKVPCSENYWLLLNDCSLGLMRYYIDNSGISSPVLLYDYLPPSISGVSYYGWGEIDYHNGRLGISYTPFNIIVSGLFDPNTGVFSCPTLIDRKAFPSYNLSPGYPGVEFSPNASKIYFTGLNSTLENNFYQYDFATKCTRSFSLRTPNDNINGCDEISQPVQIEMGADNNLYISNGWGNGWGKQIDIVANSDSLNPIFSKVLTKCTIAGQISDKLERSSEKNHSFYFSNTCKNDSTEFHYINTFCGSHSWFWNFGDLNSVNNSSTLQNPIHIFSNSGTYTVTLKIDPGTPFEETITNVVLIGNHHDFLLGNDTSICRGSDLIINGLAVPGASYEWSTGSTNNSILVNAFGSYVFNVNDNSCISRDTIRVSIKPNSAPALGPDKYICNSENILLNTNAASANTTIWSTGAVNTTTITVNQSGIYWAENSNSGCVIRDSINVFPINDYNNILGNDTVICSCSKLEYDFNMLGCTFLWDNFSFSNSATISTPGNHTIEIHLNGCIVYDTINLGIVSSPTLSLGPDIYSCDGSSVLLVANPPTGTLTWSTGQNTSEILVVNSGTYHVNVEAPCGNVTDNIQVTFNKYPESNIPDTLIFCEPMNEEIGTGNSNLNHLWSTGQTTPTINIKNPGAYSVIIDNHGCVSKDTFVVAESWFADYITLPNIITPNGDGKNDYLEYLNYDGCDFFQLDVFDRWGKRIATTNSPIKCWQGKDCSDGVYFYILKYTNPCEENTITERKGFIQLIR